MQEADIRALVAEVEAAWNAHDMHRFAACFAEEADFVNVGAMWWQGRREIEEHHAASHATRFRESRIAMQLAGAREIAPGVVIAHVTWTLDGHEASGAWRTTDTRRGIWTCTLRHRDGRIEIEATQNTESRQQPE